MYVGPKHPEQIVALQPYTEETKRETSMLRVLNKYWCIHAEESNRPHAVPEPEGTAARGGVADVPACLHTFPSTLCKLGRPH